VTETDSEDVGASSDNTQSTSRLSEMQSRHEMWLNSAGYIKARPGYVHTRIAAAGVTGVCLSYILLSLIYPGPTFASISDSKGVPITLFVTGLVLLFFLWESYRYFKARAEYYEHLEQVEREEVDREIYNLTGTGRLVELIQANQKQMVNYDSIVRSQARTSYRANLWAMTAGLVLIATGMAVATFADSTSTKYAAAIITAVGTATGGYISRTFLTVQRGAAEQMNYYFQQQLAQSYLLTAERVVSQMPSESRESQRKLVIKTALMRAASTQQVKGQDALPPIEKTRPLHRRSKTGADGP
jgi:hypothetical protein